MAGLGWWVMSRIGLRPSANVFSFMTDASPLVTHQLPWAAMSISLCLSAILFLGAWKIIESHEY